MPYVLKMFDGLVISPYIRQGDTQDIGTGAALTNFLPLPGGGFYDNYRDLRSPQGIRPLHKDMILLGTPSELREQLDAWRAKLGKRGRLTVEFDDGSLRWQWARLQDVSAPRTSDMKGGWMRVSLTWITAAQNWRGIIHSEDGWTWGDDSWIFGDGSTTFGGNAQSFSVSSGLNRVTVTHNGNVDATDVRLAFNIVGAWQDVYITNETTGQSVIIDRASIAARAMLEINSGARTVYLGNPERTLASIFRAQNMLQANTNGPHGLSSSNLVRIAGTGVYDADYYPVTITGTDQFRVPVSPRSRAFGLVSETGTSRWLANIYNLATFSDPAQWFTLAPGENAITVLWIPAPSAATMIVDFVDHYA